MMSEDRVKRVAEATSGNEDGSCAHRYVDQSDSCRLCGRQVEEPTSEQRQAMPF